MRRILQIVGCLLLLCGIVARAVPLATPVGRQCPTAQVHTIRVAVKSACGCVIGHIERAPKPGEEGFLQCQCGEKRAAQKVSAPPAPALLDPSLELRFAALPPVVAENGAPIVAIEWSAPPALRPPVRA